ncbi:MULTISPECIES: hypothetical protein [Arthrobacter]|uniref:DUF1640 domain-containing protein n=1 Tax=Arthrobacter terricola TaxID=2547396 RepID=A0A4R5KPH9_9MICC|nr:MULTISPECIES: hypothetical protein [Arthrobacter]MBT8160975.1 hypothetical protein [Arthrobacter sp. GN70]TDF96838.1 hypothetical protein E1809_08940 [Arthrobacter terricola]
MENSNAAAKAIFDLFQDWLKRVETKIDTMTGRLEGKADRAEVADLAARMDTKVDRAELERFTSKYDREAERIHTKIDTEVEKLNVKVEHESDRLDDIDKKVGLGDQRDNERKEWRQWIIPLLMTAILAAATVWQAVK